MTGDVWTRGLARVLKLLGDEMPGDPSDDSLVEKDNSDDALVHALVERDEALLAASQVKGQLAQAERGAVEL